MPEHLLIDLFQCTQHVYAEKRQYLGNCDVSFEVVSGDVGETNNMDSNVEGSSNSLPKGQRKKRSFSSLCCSCDKDKINQVLQEHFNCFTCVAFLFPGVIQAYGRKKYFYKPIWKWGILYLFETVLQMSRNL